VQFGDFAYVEHIDDFEDTNSSFIYTTSSNAEDREAMLMWRCFYDGLNVVYHFDSYLAGDSDDDLQVRYRLDNQEASETQYWQLLSAQKAAFIRMELVESFTKLAINGDELRLEVTDPFDGERIVDRFSLKGLEKGLSALYCH